MNPRSGKYPTTYRNSTAWKRGWLFSRLVSGEVSFRFPVIALPGLRNLLGYGWPFSAVFLSTSLLVVYAAATFAISLFTSVELERVSTKLGELCLVHFPVTAHSDCTAPFPQSRPSNITVTVDEANARPPPVFSLKSLTPAQIQLLAPSDLPNATLNKTKSCFLFEGEKGYVHVRTETPVFNLTGISFDYSRLQRQLDPVYQPREVSVWGLLRISTSSKGVQEYLHSPTAGTTTRPGPGNASYVLIAKGLSNPMHNVCMSMSFSEWLQASSFEAFVIQISSNWGGDHTCLAPFQFYVRDPAQGGGVYRTLFGKRFEVNFIGSTVESGYRVPFGSS